LGIVIFLVLLAIQVTYSVLKLKGRSVLKGSIPHPGVRETFPENFVEIG